MMKFYDASNPSNNGIASPVRLEWTISDEDYDVVKFVIQVQAEMLICRLYQEQLILQYMVTGQEQLQ